MAITINLLTGLDHWEGKNLVKRGSAKQFRSRTFEALVSGPLLSVGLSASLFVAKVF